MSARRRDRSRTKDAARTKDSSRTQDTARTTKSPRRRRGSRTRILTPQQESRRRRWRVVRWSALLWLPLLVVGVDLATTPLVAHQGAQEYAAGEYADAVESYEAIEGGDLVERWKGPFNLGTARGALSEEDGYGWWGALEMLDLALERAPEEHRCTVQLNRAWVWEGRGDWDMEYSTERAAWAEEAAAILEAGKEYPDDAPWYDATPEELVEDAQMGAENAEWAYGEALEARQDPACAGLSGAEQQENSESQDELEDKQEQAAAAGAPEEESESEPEPQTEAERQDALEERNAEAAAQAEAERQEAAADEAGTVDGSGGDGDEEGPGGPAPGW